MKKRIAVLVMIFTLIFSSLTVSAQAPEKAKLGLAAEYSISTFALYGQIDPRYDELEEVMKEEYYAERYPDLKLAYGSDFAKLEYHYIQYGIGEGRLASPVLDVVKYRMTYPDLQLAFGDDWDKYAQHYFQYGILERRDNGTDFDPKTYLSMYTDLQIAFGEDNYVAATKHYLEYGYAEGREYKTTLEGITVSSEGSNRTERVDYGDGSYRIIEYENGVESSRTEYAADGTIMARVQYERDAEGYLSSYTSYNYVDGVLTEYSEYELLEDGRDKAAVRYDANDNVIGSYQFHYDTAGNHIGYSYYNTNNVLSEKIEMSTDGTSTLYLYHENTGVLIRKINYDANGNIPLDTVYYDTGIIQRESFYGENGVISKRREYDTDGNLIAETLFDENGNPIS